MPKIKPFLVLGAFCLCAALSACTLAGPKTALPDTGNDDKKIVLYNWEDYIDTSLFEDFKKETGITVVLKEYSGPDEAISKIQSHPKDYDVIIGYNPTVESLISLKLLTAIDKNKIENLKYIDDVFKDPAYDPGNKYSVPYLWGTTGLAVNTDFVPANADSWRILWDPKYKNKISLLDDVREAMDAPLKYYGYSINTQNAEELANAAKMAEALRDNGVSFGDTFDNMEKLKSGEAWIAQVYNGDASYAAEGRNNIKYILPREGFEIWEDAFMVSRDSRNIDEAYRLINYLMIPEVNAKNAEKYSYATPNLEAQKYVNEEIKQNPNIYPGEAKIKLGEKRIDIGGAFSEYKRIFGLMHANAQ